MDINRIINIVKAIPKNKLQDDKTIRKAIQEAGKAAGKTFSDAELNKYVRQFKGFAQGGSSLSLLSMLLKSGVTKSQIDDIRKKIGRK